VMSPSTGKADNCRAQVRRVRGGCGFAGVDAV